MGTCHVCPPGEQSLPDAEMADHLRLIHPDLWGDGPERWPDGQVVVHDTTLEPRDFAESCAHVWPDELTPDAECLAGCGTTYADWSEEEEL